MKWWPRRPAHGNEIETDGPAPPADLPTPTNEPESPLVGILAAAREKGRAPIPSAVQSGAPAREGELGGLVPPATGPRPAEEGGGDQHGRNRFHERER